MLVDNLIGVANERAKSVRLPYEQLLEAIQEAITAARKAASNIQGVVTAGTLKKLNTSLGKLT